MFILITEEFVLFIDFVFLFAGRVFRFRTKIITIEALVLQFLYKVQLNTIKEERAYGQNMESTSEKSLFERERLQHAMRAVSSPDENQQKAVEKRRDLHLK